MARPQEGYYIMYLRKSRADAEKEKYGQFETLAIHEKTLTELAQRKHYPIAKIYRELVCGESIEERTEFKKVLDHIADPYCLGVIVHAVDRLGRGDPMEYGLILSSLKYTNTLVVTPNRDYDPNNPDDAQQLKLQMFVSNIEFEHIRERLHGGNIRSAKDGNYQGSKPPYGYDKVPYKSALTPNAKEAPIVHLIFKLACDGLNKGAIARHLNDSGIPTRFGCLWVSSRISTILSNPVYKGMVRYGYRRQRVVSRDGLKFVKKTTVSEEGKYVLVKGKHEPLVTEEAWELANKRAFEGVPVKRNLGIKNPLAGLIVCGKCGRALIRQTVRNKQRRPYDRLHHAYYTECQCKSIRLDYVMDCLCDALEEVATELETGSVQCGTDPAEIEAIERTLADESRKLDKLIELFNADAITVYEFKDRREASDVLVKQLREKHDELTAKMVDPDEIAFTTREALMLLRDESVDAELKNNALKRFVERIEYEEIDQARKNRQIKLTVHLRGLN